MSVGFVDPAIESFQRAARDVPAYRILLEEAGIRADEIRGESDFARLPILEKQSTFQRFPIDQLCSGGKLGRLGSVLTSSGHSGIFAYGLTAADQGLAETAQWIDDGLDGVFAVRSRPTLLINCLPMGVKIPTQACTLAETSVRPDMAVGLVKAFGHHHEQIILVGETAFIKNLLELGLRNGVNWKRFRVNVIVGEEPLAENARKYLESVLGHVPSSPQSGLVCSSMGVAELGLNLFFEVSPYGSLVPLRRMLHENAELRREILGERTTVPSLFTYDPRRIFVESDRSGRLIMTTLDPRQRVPLIRYATGDQGKAVRIPPHLSSTFERHGIDCRLFEMLPIVAIEGRGEHALGDGKPIYPEEVKEGIYRDQSLVPLTTANFRLVSSADRVRVRIQLSPGVDPDPKVQENFARAIGAYVSAPFEVSCEAYESFGSGMLLDYERKFNYLGK